MSWRLEEEIRSAAREIASLVSGYWVLVVMLLILIPLVTVVAGRGEASALVEEVQRCSVDLEASGRDSCEFEVHLDSVEAYKRGDGLCARTVYALQPDLPDWIPGDSLLEGIFKFTLKGPSVCREIGQFRLEGGREVFLDGDCHVALRVEEDLVLEFSCARPG